jgi:ribosomal protein S12 methylthiotransferase
VKLGLITLGCDKNSVDSERYAAALAGRGVELTADLAEAGIIVVNTCGFIDAAKKESIDAIVEAGRYKDEGSCRAVVAVGCMVQRHRQELEEALPEVDLFLGAADMERLLPELDARGLLEEPIELHPGDRIYCGDLPHVRYLKVSEGCDHGCAFCAIPLMRGRHRSFGLADVIREAQLLELQGAREINLVAQDLAHYGRDLRDGTSLAALLRALVRETSIPWIRMLYLYSTGITPGLLDVVAGEPRIVPYLDMPMQHASDEVLKRMRRPERRTVIRDRVARLRDAIPDVALRTTCIVGFPGETETDFQSLLEFLEEVQFDRVGGFTYSPQEGTRAFDYPDDVPDSLKRERLERLTELQRIITAERYERHLGKPVPAMVDRPGAVGECAQARVVWQADDIDGITRVATDARPGALIEVRVDAVDDYDFDATILRVVDAPAVALPPRQARTLPVMATSVGSFGR